MFVSLRLLTRDYSEVQFLIKQEGENKEIKGCQPICMFAHVKLEILNTNDRGVHIVAVACGVTRVLFT